jgi:Ca-activated chloride channel family protein
MADFHFLRPLWLLLWLAVPLLPLLYRYLSGSDNGWQRIIPGPMLQPLIRRRGESGGKRRPILPMVMLSLALLSVALAGPTWRKAPSPLQQQDDSLVIVLDLSLSMLANDLQPDRLTRAKRKIRDLLAERQASLTALVVYTADAHTVTPLTSDRATIESMLGVLDPLIMPAPGNRADLAVSRAIQLLEQGAPGKGRILLISDQVAERYQQRIRTMVNDSP